MSLKIVNLYKVKVASATGGRASPVDVLVTQIGSKQCKTLFAIQLELGVHRIVNTGFQTALARVGNVIDAFHGASFTKLE